MPKEISIAEEAGMSFEDRCGDALTGLSRLWILFQCLSTEDLNFQQECTQNKEAFLAGLDEISRKKIARLLEELNNTGTEIDEQFYKRMWDEMLVLTRELYGSDATDFALKTMEVSNAKN